MCREFCRALRRRERASRPVLDVLDRRDVLHARTAETDQSVAELLLRSLTEPRAAGMDPRHVYWGLIERLHNPATTTQIVNIEFLNGDLDAGTCVSSSHAFVLCQRTPGEYARIIERLTSPESAFSIVRWFHPRDLDRRLRELSGVFPVDRVSAYHLRIEVRPDHDALARAIAEQQGRQFREYDFGARGRKNSRLLGDVMIQSALTNYALNGRYDSARDCDRTTGSRGVPPPGESTGHQALIREILNGPTPQTPSRGSPVLGVMTEAEALRATGFLWTGGHHLARPLLIDIDD